MQDRDGITPAHARASGGGSTLRLFAALRVGSEVAYDLERHAEVLAARAPGSLVVPAADMYVSIVDFGRVAEEVVPAVAQALDLAAPRVYGTVGCTVSGSVLGDDGRARAVRVSLDLLVLLAAMRDDLLDATAPYAPELVREAWEPHVTVLRAAPESTLPYAATRFDLQPEAGTWLATDVELVAAITGPLGQHVRRLHSTPFGAHARTDG